MNWLWLNKTWVFSGVGVAVLAFLARLFFRARGFGHYAQVSADRNSSVLGSPVASGSNISQIVNIGTTYSPVVQPNPTYSDRPTPTEIGKQLLALPVFQRKAATSSYLGLKVRWRVKLSALDQISPYQRKAASSTDPTHDLTAVDEGWKTVRMYVDIERFPRLKISHEGTAMEISGTIEYVSDAGGVRLRDVDISFEE